ncbi:4781_t:CDS:2 [Funneliformis geosporum]|uniref:18199_t:CDS:1 n=1 Tax=Funneliformis geosporum TaxID=1117311 RepID=A0A9W4T0N1_9GLOM|nr:18199_t:CDS:2 [Funneliformis geosporum]CAI2191509.1 4781_t:CDS:2 [Funneliformis geosporum]
MNIKELERRNKELNAKLEEAKQESSNFSSSLVRKIQQLENELSRVKHMNQVLTEENEKILKREFMLNPIMQRNESYTEKKHTDTVEKVTNDYESSYPHDDIVKIENSIITDLSVELDRTLLNTFERVHKESDHSIIEKLQDKIESLNYDNKCLRLYIEKILNRIMEVQGAEEILSSAPECKNQSVSNPVTSTTDSFSFNDYLTLEKIERRRSWSGSQPQDNFTSNDKIMVEEPSQIYPIPNKGVSNEDTITLSDVPKRTQRRNSNSASGGKIAKRFSIFNWVGGATKVERKDDPFMRPIFLVQENERKK